MRNRICGKVFEVCKGHPHAHFSAAPLLAPLWCGQSITPDGVKASGWRPLGRSATQPLPTSRPKRVFAAKDPAGSDVRDSLDCYHRAVVSR